MQLVHAEEESPATVQCVIRLVSRRRLRACLLHGMIKVRGALVWLRGSLS